MNMKTNKAISIDRFREARQLIRHQLSMMPKTRPVALPICFGTSEWPKNDCDFYRDNSATLWLAINKSTGQFLVHSKEPVNSMANFPGEISKEYSVLSSF